MARKPLGPMDINEYYKAMGARPEADAWEMPLYNTVNGLPITGQGREAVKNSGNFVAPVYNHQGKPILSNKDVPGQQNGDPTYQIEVYRPGTMPGQQFKAPRYNDSSGKPILNGEPQESGSQNVYRPSEIKKTGVATPLSRKDLSLGLGESRKVFLNNCFSADVPGMPFLLGNFTKISGMESEWELETYHEGGDNSGYHMFPKQVKNSRLVFEYGLGFIDTLSKWFTATKLGMMVKMPMMVYLLNEKGLPIKLWMVLDAMPVKYTVPGFDAMASEVVITRLEFIHNGIIGIL